MIESTMEFKNFFDNRFITEAPMPPMGGPGGPPGVPSGLPPGGPGGLPGGGLPPPPMGGGGGPLSLGGGPPMGGPPGGPKQDGPVLKVDSPDIWSLLGKILGAK